jgi:hypothetical protein
MQPPHARALHAAGLCTAEALGVADEQQVAEALAAGLPRAAAPKGKAKDKG